MASKDANLSKMIVSREVEYEMIPLHDLLSFINIPSIQRRLDATHRDAILQHWTSRPDGRPRLILPIVIAELVEQNTPQSTVTSDNALGAMARQVLNKTASPFAQAIVAHENTAHFNSAISTSSRGDCRCFVIDGQHRVAALEQFLRTYPNLNGWNGLVPVCRIRCESESEMRELFFEINRSTPVNLFGGVDSHRFVQVVQQYFVDNYSRFVKTSLNPRVPNLNLESLGNALVAANACSRLRGDPLLFIDAMCNLNTYYRTAPRNQFGRVVRGRLDRCTSRNSPLFITAYKKFGWVERAVLVAEGSSPATLPVVSRDHRAKIPKKLRTRVWDKRNNPRLVDGVCYVCRDPIKRDGFECGHVIAVFNGGDNSINNLEPICSCCNRDMGTENLHQFRTQYGFV